MSTTEPIVAAMTAGPTGYPNTTVGMLMQQRDSTLGSAKSAQDAADRYLALVDENTTRAASLQDAIDSLGGDQPMVPLPST
jgi:hypothetical protein